MPYSVQLYTVHSAGKGRFIGTMKTFNNGFPEMLNLEQRVSVKPLETRRMRGVLSKNTTFDVYRIPATTLPTAMSKKAGDFSYV